MHKWWQHLLLSLHALKVMARIQCSNTPLPESALWTHNVRLSEKHLNTWALMELSCEVGAKPFTGVKSK